MNLKSTDRLALIIILSFWFWLSFSGALLAEPEPIVIGMSAAFTGTSANLGRELYQGSMAYFDHINQLGGINGHQIVIKAYDDGYDPLPAIKNTIRLVEKDRVSLLFDYVGSPTVTGILPLLKKYQSQDIFLLFPFTGAQPHRQPPYEQLVFNLRASYREETAGLVAHFLALGRKRIAVFYQIDAYGRSGWDGVRRKLEQFGLPIVAEATYRRGAEFSSSFLPQVEIIQQANPEAIISIGSYQACAGFIRDARDAGLDIPIANISFVDSESLLQLLLETGKQNQRDYTYNLINSQVVPSYEDLSLPAVREYRQLINTYPNKLPKHIVQEDYQNSGYTFVSFEGFLNAKLLVTILKNMPDFSQNFFLKTTIEKMNNVDLGIGVPIHFSSKSHQGLHKIYYTTIENNKNVPIIGWSQWLKK